MDTDRKWIVVRIDGKIAAVSTDYRKLAEISARLAMESRNETGKGAKGKAKTKGYGIFGEITAVSVSLEEVWKLRQTAQWDDLILFGTDFQKRVWRKLWDLTHLEDTGIQADTATRIKTENSSRPGLISYSDFAELCENKAGVRAVAHAIGLNPLSVIIPCHLVVPKESMDKIADIRRKMESTIFKGDDICMDSLLRDKSFDFGEYAPGRELKRHLIQLELG